MAGPVAWLSVRLPSPESRERGGDALRITDCREGGGRHLVRLEKGPCACHWVKGQTRGTLVLL